MKRIRLPRKHSQIPPLKQSFWLLNKVKCQVESLEIPYQEIEKEFEQKRAETRQVKIEKKTTDYIL